MILPNSYETILDKIKQDWFMSGWEAARKCQCGDCRVLGTLKEENEN